MTGFTSPRLSAYAALAAAGLIAGLAFGRVEPVGLAAPFVLALVAAVAGREPEVSVQLSLDRGQHFCISRNMKKSLALEAFGALSQETHVAGTAAQARTREYVIAQMKAWGLETELRTYDIWMPHATEVRVWRVAPDTARLSLGEPVLPNDPVAALPQYPTVNGYSGQGDEPP